MSGPLKIWLEREDALLRLRLARPKGNIIDGGMIKALSDAFSTIPANTGLRGVLLDHEGPHFSFGASVEEHLPENCAAMLHALHELIGQMLDCPVPLLVAANGQCLGGGFELAAAGGPIFASPDARFGQPEIKLAVFAPAASALLPERIAQMHAEDLLASGRSISGKKAVKIGLAVAASDEPEAAALEYFDKHLAPLSASSLRFSIRAARSDFAARVKARLVVLEKLYLDELMQTKDAHEGLAAFLEKRAARWEHR